MQSFDVALLTDRRYTARSAAEGNWYLRNILDDDGLLQEALTRRGRTSLRVDWAEPEIDCSLFRCGRGFMGVAVVPGWQGGRFFLPSPALRLYGSVTGNVHFNNHAVVD